MRATSIESYIEEHGAGRLADRNKQVYDFICGCSHPETDREIARDMGFMDPNKTRPRRRELEVEGLVESAGKRMCMVSGKTVHTWRATKKMVERTNKCPKCGYLVPIKNIGFYYEETCPKCFTEFKI